MAERSLGLLNYRSAGDMAAEESEQERQRQEEEQRRRDMVEQSLAGHIRTSWENAKMARQDIEKRMLDCLRRRKGEYDPGKLSAIRQEGGSEIYMMLTATKQRAAAAWIRDVLMPSNERPWGLEPTPVADIPTPWMQRVQADIAQQMQAMTAQGQQVTPDQQQAMLEDGKERLRSAVQKVARKAAERHESLIDDQLAEGGWQEALESFIDDFATYPAAVLKGPVMRRVPSLAWSEGWQPVKTTEIRPEFERVSPFDLYPSADATNIDDASSIIERIRYVRAHLNQLRGVPGYSDDALDRVLEDYGQGGLRDWLWTDGEREQLEGRGHEWLSQGETIDGLQYWGSAQGLSLLQWGMDPDVIDDPLADYEIEAVLIGQHVVRCVINRNPLGKRPYHKASYQPVPGSFWGMSISELMSDIQDTCNATARAMVNNMAIASGPQVEVTDRVDPSEDITSLYPWKVWKTRSSMVAANDPAVRFFQPNSNAAELMGVYEKFEVKADDATNIPRYTYGNEKVGGAGNTASGLSMLMESANKGIKDAIRFIDRGVIRRVIEALWLHNMQYSNDQSIKGDCKAVPRGSSAMLQREQTQALRQQFLQMTNNELDMSIIGRDGRARLLRAVAEQLDMRDLIPDDREIESQLNQQQQSQQQAQELEQQAKQAEMQETAAKAQKAQADAQSAQAETQQDQAMMPLEQQKMLAEILKLIGEIRGNQSAGMESAGAAGTDPRRADARRHDGTAPAERPGRPGIGAGTPFSPPAGPGLSGPGMA